MNYFQLLEIIIVLASAIIAYIKNEQALDAKAIKQQVIDVFDPEKPDVDMPDEVPKRVYTSSPEVIAFMQTGESPEDQMRIAATVKGNEEQGIYDYTVKTAHHLYHVYYGGIIGGAAF